MNPEELAKLLLRFRHDPLGFVMAMFPWGEGLLADFSGPLDWQAKVLKKIAEVRPNRPVRVAVASGHGIGKALAIDELVLTPLGFKPIKDVKVGDYVIGPDGLPTLVTGEAWFEDRPLYKVTFDDGASVVVDAAHEWTVKGRQQRRNGLGWVTLETAEILRLGVKRKNGKSFTRQWEIPSYTPPVLHPQPILDPYLLGVWLGDGDKKTGRVTNIDHEVWEELKFRGFSFGVGDKTKTVLGVENLLPKVTTETAHVPDEYKINSPTVRRAVLQGLLDTDGWVEKNGTTIGFCSVSKRLVSDVIWLARSLGLKARWQTPRRGSYKRPDGKIIKCRMVYRCSITADGSELFKIKRKQEALHVPQDRYLKRWIDSIEPVGRGPTKCIEVARPDGLFLTRDFIVTHNSALSAWIILWAMATFPQTRGVVTANTKTQLETKTFAELSRWFNLSPLPEFFKLTATSLAWKDEEYAKTWRCDIVPWSAHNPEAFAGLHNRGRRQFVLFDEASAIDDIIAETASGAMTDENTERLWIQFGNPTRNTGYFRECFPPDGRFSRYWWTMHVDSRDVPITDKEYIRQLAEAYGEDSDYFRVRVKGEFPLSNTLEFIPRKLVREAAARELKPSEWESDPVVMGVDIARGGPDETVVFVRQGLNGRLGLYRWNSPDLVATAERVAVLAAKHRPSLICLDAGGVGGGVVDVLNRSGLSGIIPVNFGERPLGMFPGVNCLNRRVEMWYAMRQWLQNGGTIPQDDILIDELCSVYQKLPRSERLADKLVLESKEDVRSRGGKSPDAADALALTFAMPVQHHIAGVAQTRLVEYNPIGKHLERELKEGW